MLKSRTNISLEHVPYKGTPQAVSDVTAGFAQLFFETPGPVLGQIQSGQLTPLAVTSRTRLPVLPQVPTMEEQGIGGFELQGWVGIAVPAGTPRPVIDKLAAACQDALSLASLRERVEPQGYLIDYAGPDEFSAFIRSEMPKWGGLMKAAGVKME